ncbi:HD-GYP domain-containing protein [Paenibacillus alginolyticus]|uniref:HD-GYP domain-containing protein n=1 Tax=Paenibacillus alginolyticus TaxID=59839 RepID=UPI0004259A5C|nr:HD-GYP domain-containing protein [Paenibacillus alginolyticus]MCY9666289.1 HD-GYP domain-containing protein [Paenibacillus alginolyticus]
MINPMNKVEINNWLVRKTTAYTVCFFIVLFAVVLIDEIYPRENLTSMYLVPLVVAGFAFWKHLSVQIIVAGVLTWVNKFYSPYGHLLSIHVVVSQWLTFTLAILSVSTSIRFYIRDKENTLNLTFALAKSLDSRDAHTAFHSENVAKYAFLIAKEMKLSNRVCDHIYLGGLLHDIGKIGVPESTLSKPTSLTEDEYNAIKQHAIIGYNMVKHIPSFKKNGILDMILYHHERYDGTGYPERLKGERIPRLARILSVADSFDAMTSTRVYRNKLDVAYATNQLRKNRGTQFDPEITDVFLKILEKKGPHILLHMEDIKRARTSFVTS